MDKARSSELLRSWYDHLVLNPASLSDSSQNHGSSSSLRSSLLAFLINPDYSNEETMREQFGKIHNDKSVDNIDVDDANNLSLGLCAEDEDDIVKCLLSSSSPSFSASSHCHEFKGFSLKNGLQFANNLQSFKARIMENHQKEPQRRDVINMTSSSDAHTRSKPVQQVQPQMNANAFKSPAPTLFSHPFKPPSIKQPENSSNNNNVSQRAGQRNNTMGNKRVYGDIHSGSSGYNKSTANTSFNRESDSSVHTYEQMERKNPFKSGKDQFLEDGGSFPTAPPSNLQTSSNVANKLSQRVFNNPGSSSSKGKKDQSKDLPPELAHLNPQIVEKI